MAVSVTTVPEVIVDAAPELVVAVSFVVVAVLPCAVAGRPLSQIRQSRATTGMQQRRADKAKAKQRHTAGRPHQYRIPIDLTPKVRETAQKLVTPARQPWFG